MVKKRILIVDDERAMRMIMIGALRSDNREIDVAENGVEAIEYIDRTSYDLIITDYSMPEMDGLELSRFIALKFPAVSVLIVSGNESIRDLLENDNVIFFPKPFTVIELKRIVEKILNGKG